MHGWQAVASVGDYSGGVNVERVLAGLLAGLLAVALVSCGGGGDAGESNGGGSNPGGSGSAVNGVASYTRMNITLDPVSVTRYSMQVDLVPFNTITYDPASISTLRTTAVNLQVLNGTTVFGQQRYSLQSATCTGVGGSTGYEAVMLFDRSGSMATNDPADDTLAAAREFVARMDRFGNILVGAFPGGFTGRPTFPVTFYGSGFTSDQTQLLAHIGSVGGPNGNTPLWDSMLQSVFKFSTFTPPPGATRALLTFSDGEDTQSTQSPAAVQSNALQRHTKVFAINLRNSNSQNLDAIALATGGAVYSTDDARKLIAFYGTLGRLLSGASRTCSATIAVEFVPDSGVGEVGYGPAGRMKATLEFDGMSDASMPTLVESQLTLPLYPGRKIGQSTAGRSVYETDIFTPNMNCVELVPATQTGGRGPLALNNCTAPIWVAVCNQASPATCNRGVVEPGQAISAFASSNWAQCPWEAPFGKFESVVSFGTAPTQSISQWTLAASSNYRCAYTARGPF
jgi:hypothetical protein